MSALPQRAAKRLPNGLSKERILDAAERLFSELGTDAVSFRDLAAAAQVSLSAIHYHFGSKETVLAEVFARQARRLVVRRQELLSGLRRDRKGGYPLRGILDAFLRPAFEVTRGDRNDLFNRLLARLAVQPGDLTRTIVSEAFDASDNAFLREFGIALPGLSRSDLHWRFHFLVGGMIYTMSDSGQLVGLSAGLCSASNTAEALGNLVHTFEALFRADAAVAFGGQA